jgi:tRNA threonylcarbamoyladenosine biosynthesis protein TsaB
VFSAFYRAAPGGVQRETELRVGRPETLAADIEATGEEVLVVGDGAIVHRQTLGAVGTELAGPEVGWPEATVLAQLAVPRFVREETQRPEDLRPVYLRTADARIGWEERGRLRGGEVPT